MQRFLSGISGPVVILGDFNTPAESDIYSRHWNQFGDAFDLCGFGFGMTHISTSSSVRIDHILLDSGGWDISRCWVRTGGRIATPAADSGHSADRCSPITLGAPGSVNEIPPLCR